MPVKKEKTTTKKKEVPAKPDKVSKVSAKSDVAQFASLANTGKKEKVEFLTSPTGLLKLGYNAGDTASFTKGQCEFLYDLGLAKKA